VEEPDNVILASFHPTWFEGTGLGHKIGRLEITKLGLEVLDVVVLTGVVVQERTDDHKYAVISYLIEGTDE
jgi:hypothetical protein